MRFILFVLLILTIIVTGVANAETVVFPPEDEIRFQNWTFDGSGGWSLGGGSGLSYSWDANISNGYLYLYAKSYVPYANSGSSSAYAYASQTVNLTGVKYLVFYCSVAMYGSSALKVYIDNTVVWSWGAGGSYVRGSKLVVLDVSAYSGTRTVKFYVNAYSSADVYVADEDYCQAYIYYVFCAEDKLRNVNLYFEDVRNHKYVNNVALNYTLNSKHYTNIFNSGQTLVVDTNTTLTTNIAAAIAEDGQLIFDDLPKTWRIFGDAHLILLLETDADASLTLKFLDNSTGGYLDNVYVEGWVNIPSVDMELPFSGYHNYTYTINVPSGSDIWVGKVERSGYTTNFVAAVFTVTADQTFTITFDPKVSEAPTKKQLHVYFYDAYNDMLLDNVNFTLMDENGTVIYQGTYDYQATFDVDTWKTYLWKANKTGYYDVNGTLFTEPGVDTYVLKVALVPILPVIPQTGKTIVGFIVQYENGTYAENVVVTLNGISKVTNRWGYCYFEVDVNNTYAYTVSGDGFDAFGGSVKVGTNPVLVTVVIPLAGEGFDGEAGGGGGGGTSPLTLDDAINVIYDSSYSIISLALLVAFVNLLYMLMPRRR